MRVLKVTAAVALILLIVPLHGDDKAGEPIVQPEDSGDGCVECARAGDDIICGGEPTAAGWMNCEGGWIWLCDGYAGCDKEPNCGDRCAIA